MWASVKVFPGIRDGGRLPAGGCLMVILGLATMGAAFEYLYVVVPCWP